MDKGHGFDAVAAFLEDVEGVGVLDVRGLQLEEAGDDLEVVFDAMVDFLEEDFLFLEGGFDADLGFLLLGHVADDGRK